VPSPVHLANIERTASYQPGSAQRVVALSLIYFKDLTSQFHGLEMASLTGLILFSSWFKYQLDAASLPVPK
jgi:uncharacterized membrane protein YqjE